MLSKFIGYLCLAGAVVLFVVVLYRHYGLAPAPLLFSPTQLLQSTWQGYKETYLDPQTFRTIDKQRGNVTTSEGQSYTMLRAVWVGDKETFDNSWNWTAANLKRPTDHLFAWLWGTRTDGTEGILAAQNGGNTASDADSDIALALIFAYARWQDPEYLSQARLIISDIWEQEVVTAGGSPYLAADNIEKNSKSPWVVVNPSYLSPASYHIFALADPGHPWETLRANSYSMLKASMDLTYGSSTTAHLPPDWILVSRSSGAILNSSTNAHDTNFGFDAMRVPFRVALDSEWFGNSDATALLAQFSFLSDQWKRSGSLAATYTHAGVPVSQEQAAALYGATIGYFMSADTAEAKSMYQTKLTPLYDPGTGAWSMPLSYYDDNWVWFGIALYNHALPNLTANLPAEAFK